MKWLSNYIFLLAYQCGQSCNFDFSCGKNSWEINGNVGKITSSVKKLSFKNKNKIPSV